MARGFGATFGAGTTDIIQCGTTLSLTGPMTYSAWFYAISTGPATFGRILDTTSGGGFLLVYNNAPAFLVRRRFSTTNGTWTFVDPGQNQWNHVVVSHDGSLSPPTIYVNGIAVTVTTVTTPVGSTASPGGPFTIGNTPATNNVWDGKLGDIAVWSGAALSKAEARSLYQGADPLTIRPQYLAEYISTGSGKAASLKQSVQPTTSGTKPASDRFRLLPLSPRGVFAALSGGAVAFAGTSAVTFGQTGKLTAPLALAGTSAVTFGQIGLVTAALTVAGTSAVTFGQSASLTTKPNITAASAVTFGQSGLVTAPLTVAGTSAVTFGQSAALTIPGSLAVAGTSAVVFGQSGALTAPLQLTGTSAVLFAQTGALTAPLGMAGTSAVTFGQSGALTTTPQIAAITAVTFGQTAALTIPSGLAVAGTSAVTFGQSGALSAVQYLSGTSAVTFSQQATISTTVTFAGAGGWGDVNTGMGTGTRKQKRPVKKIKSFHELAQEMRAELMAEAFGPVVQAKSATQTKSVVQAKPYPAAIAGEHDDDDDDEEVLIADYMMRLHSSFSILQHLMGGK